MQPLRDTPLRLGRPEVEATIEPFAKRTTKDDPAWRSAVAARRWNARKKLIKRFLGLKRRDNTAVAREYEKHWRSFDFDSYAPPASPPDDGHPWEWGGDAYLMPSVGGARARLLYLMRVIEWLRPASALEVGFGNGINLLPLACRFPEIRFAGLELTEQGAAKAKAAQRETALPGPLQAFSPERLVDVTAHRRIDFDQGSAAAMPFGDGAYDLVFSSLALEQMERIRPRVLAEFSRVAARHTAMLEPFKDTNDTGFPREYVLARNYFRGAVADLPTYGLRPILVTGDMPAESWLKPCLVVCERRPVSASHARFAWRAAAAAATSASLRIGLCARAASASSSAAGRADNHASTVTASQSRAVGDTQRRLVLEALRRIQQARYLLRAQDDRQLARLPAGSRNARQRRSPRWAAM